MARVPADAPSAISPAARWIELPDHRTQVTDEGTGPATILIHSLGLDQRMWDAAAPLLRQAGLRTVAYDVRGHGSAAEARPARSIDELADDLRDLLDALEIARPTVIGTSLGGAIAQRFAARYRDRVSGLAFIASPSAGLPAFEERAESGENGLHHLVDGTLQRWFGSDYDDEAAGPRYAMACLATLSPAHWCASWRAIAGFDPRGESLPDVPTVLVSGELDTSTPASVMAAIDQRRVGPGGSVDIPNAPHLLVMTHPRPVVRALVSGLQGRSP